MDYEPTLEFARDCDATDPLRGYRGQFHFPSLDTPEMVYFSGHSLGLQPKTVRAAVELELDEWAKYGVDGHFHSTNPWYSYHELLTPPMARLVGAQDSEVVCMNSLTTNIHLLFVSFYRPTAERYKIIAEAKMFPSDRYLLETQARFHGFHPDDAIIEIAPPEGEFLIREQDILAAIEEHADDLLAIVLTHAHEDHMGAVARLWPRLKAPSRSGRNSPAQCRANPKPAAAPTLGGKPFFLSADR